MMDITCFIQGFIVGMFASAIAIIIVKWFLEVRE